MKRVGGSCAIILALCLAGCSSNQLNSVDKPKLPTRVEGASDRVINKLQSELNLQGVRVITMGQNYLISIPSSMLFSNQSPHIHWGAYALLNQIVCYMQEFRKISVHVNAYSSKYVSSRREHALTLARARAVAEYLWARNIDSRFIFTQGMGSDKPIIAFPKRGDTSQNSRIEITFRRLVA